MEEGIILVNPMSIGGLGLFSDVRVLGQRSFQNPPHTSKTPRMRIQELA
jgi:hypothetical protein